MRARAVRLAFEQRRPLSGARPANCLAGCVAYRFDVVAVDLNSRDIVGSAAAGHVRICRRIGERHLGSELVVLTHEQHREFPDTREIQSFMEGSVVHCAVAEERDRNTIGPQQFETVACAGCLQDARTHDAAGAHQPDFGREQVHGSAAAPRAAGPAAEQFGDEFADGQSFRERVSVAAVRAEDGIVRTKVRTHASGDCFLADVGVASAMNQPARVTSCELLLRRANQLHGAVEVSGVGAHCAAIRPPVPHRSAAVQRQIAAVHGDQRAGDPFGGVGRKQHCEPFDVVGPAEAAGRDAAQKLIAQARHFGDALLQARIENLGRQNRVDAHTGAGPFGAQLPCHLRDGAHGHAVGDVASAERGDTGERTDIHDAAAAGGEHPPACFLTGAEAAEDEVAPHLLDVLETDLLRRRHDGFPGHVSEKIDASEFGIELGEDRSHLSRFGDIACDGNCPAADGGDFRRRAIHARFVAVNDEKIRARFGERHRHRAPHALGGSGDYGHFVREIEHFGNHV